MVVKKDITTFEWWDGDFIAELCDSEFDYYTKGRIGPEQFIYSKDDNEINQRFKVTGNKI
jgi:hypothetical protein